VKLQRYHPRVFLKYSFGLLSVKSVAIQYIDIAYVFYTIAVKVVVVKVGNIPKKFRQIAIRVYTALANISGLVLVLV
jgi:hypothetical protein